MPESERKSRLEYELTHCVSAVHRFNHYTTRTPPRHYFYLIYRWNPKGYYHSRSKWTWKWWQWKGTPHSPKVQDWNLTIRSYSVISKTLVWGGVLLLWGDTVGVFYSLSWLVIYYIYVYIQVKIVYAKNQRHMNMSELF